MKTELGCVIIFDPPTHAHTQTLVGSLSNVTLHPPELTTLNETSSATILAVTTLLASSFPEMSA